MNTRNMQGFIAKRLASDSISLVYSNTVDSGDGSALVENEIISCLASVNDLNSNDIERLEKAGIIIKTGVTIVINSAPYSYEPDTVTYNGKNYRVVNWTVTEENSNITVVATCEEISIPAAT